MSNTTDHEKEIFNEALELPSPEARAAFLQGACGKDQALRQRIEAWLVAHASADGFIPTRERNNDLTALTQTPLSEQPGTLIGRYKLLQQIGEGGMGVVYMAEQEVPVRRRVALKIIKLGMDTRQVVARFEAERQALALMDHPNIARVLDGGATDTGRPYFVMELVQGVPITEFCDKTKLPAKERLKLFMQVCHAIQSAHQKGIIHRDIKPSNVLVTLHDGAPVPKVIDFGIAKATNQKLTEKTLFTNFATMIGTPAYMSPEQAEMSGLDIDTRTDIYALGVLLYALLTGTTPFPEKRLRSLGYGEMQRVILEEEPERPSTRLSTMANEQKTIVARNCGEELSSLNDLLKGDLDWIVMKCLEKNRQRRYESVNGLASDIQRHLTNEPVIARPPSAGYRFQKMVRRNRSVALAAGAVAVTLILALAFITTAFLRERNARLAAKEAERGREEARHATKAETIRADTLAEFLNSFFDSVIPELAKRGHREGIKRLLKVTDYVATTLTNAPRAEADVRFGIGMTYFALLDDYPASRPQLQRVEELGTALGEPGKKLVSIAHIYRISSQMWEKNDTNLADALFQLGKAAMSQEPPDTEAATCAFSSGAYFHSFFGDYAKAEKFAQETLLVSPKVGIAFDVLARLRATRGDFAGADEAAQQLMSIIPTLRGGFESEKKEFVETYAATLSSGGRFRMAEQELRQALKAVPSDDSQLKTILTANLGIVIARGGDYGRGLEILTNSVTDPLCPANLWLATAHLATLLGETNLHHSLCLSGLALWASGADSSTSQSLAEPLLMLPIDPGMLPIARRLVDQSLQGPPWTRALGQFDFALLEYRSGRLSEAAHELDEYFRVAQEVKKDFAALSCGWFLRALVETRSDHTASARDAYRAGLKLHSAVFGGPGKPHTGYWFGADLAAELLRREAASLLGDAVPASP